MSSHRSITDTDDLVFDGQEMTISTWAYINSTDANSCLVSKPWNGGGKYNYTLCHDGTDITFGMIGA